MSPSTAYAPARIEPEFSLAPPESFSDSIAAKLRADGSVCFRVLGASMFPWIRTGDLVFVRKFEFEQVSRGDVVLFERAQRLFVHRVLRGGTNGAGMITKGDALDAEDAPVSRGEFLGRLIRIHRGDHHIDMESMGWNLLGRLLARVSRASFLLYRPARTMKHLLLD